MKHNQSLILAEISNYYSARLAEHGTTPRGVDWNGELGQTQRFEQLCKIIDTSEHFSVNDLGCGYGAFNSYLMTQYESFSYAGFDISNEMINAAKEIHYNVQAARFIESSQPDEIADYSMASGIFNIRLEHSDKDWQSYIEDTLDILDNKSRLGFSFNCLTSYSDTDKMREYLYYADPSIIFDYCIRHHSRNVAILHDYGLYEFTILVRKQS